MSGLITYMRHICESYNSVPNLPSDLFHEWETDTATQMRTYLVNNITSPLGLNPISSGPISSFRPTSYSAGALDLMDFKKGFKREIAAYPTLKDKRYFDRFTGSLFIVHMSLKCSEVLDPTYTPGSEPEDYTPGSEPEEEELFEAKQTFMFSVFNANLLTDMCKAIVRKHLNTTAQVVWQELNDHMRTSSKGASEKRRLTQYVTNTVLDDRFKGSAEQFVLHG